MLNIKGLHVLIEGKKILNDFNLEVKKGEVHAIMGPNGAGKSTLAAVLAGKPCYEIEKGSIVFEGENIQEISVEERAVRGIFLAFQYPVEIPGLTSINFLKTAVNEIRKQKGQSPMSSLDFMSYIKEKAKLIGLEESFLKRSLNEGFSGGEKKRNEILQMAVLDPKLTILDETDSGLDIDALRIISNGIQQLKSKEKAMILITHYQRILNYVVPDVVHVLYNGRIIKTGGKDLALVLEKEGYNNLIQEFVKE